MKQFLRYIKHVIWFRFFGFFNSFTQNGDNIKNIRDTKKEKRCFIVATGPSLIPEDLELIKNEDTFGVNSIFLMYDKTDWRPRYYVCTDAPYLDKLIKSYRIVPRELCVENIFLNRATKKHNPTFLDERILWISFSPWNRIYNFKDYKFSPDISKGMYAFGTVTNIAICIAMYMGYKEIYLLGADCSNLNRHFVNDVTDQDKDEKYVKEVIQVQLKGYEIMKKETERRSVYIYNATRGGALEIFPRVRLEDVLS